MKAPGRPHQALPRLLRATQRISSTHWSGDFRRAAPLPPKGFPLPSPGRDPITALLGHRPAEAGGQDVPPLSHFPD